MCVCVCVCVCWGGGGGLGSQSVNSFFFFFFFVCFHMQFPFLVYTLKYHSILPGLDSWINPGSCACSLRCH